MQRIVVSVRGGYSPDVIRVRQGLPVELVFDRQESGDCTSRVVFADLQLSAALPAYERTTVRLPSAVAGTFGFACGMNARIARVIRAGVEMDVPVGDGRGLDHRVPLRARPDDPPVDHGRHRQGRPRRDSDPLGGCAGNSAQVEHGRARQTGTITAGKPALTDVRAYGGWPENEMLRLVAAVAADSEHPLGAAIVAGARSRGISLAPVSGFESAPARVCKPRWTGMPW